MLATYGRFLFNPCRIAVFICIPLHRSIIYCHFSVCNGCLSTLTKMSELVVKDSIIINEGQGRREIQLCFGDITKLPMKDKVDIIMISAFPGNYAASKGTLIAALQQAFQLQVRDLARNKAEDLRKHFHCWTSHKLPSTLPYGRLLCFEHFSHNQTPSYGFQPYQLVSSLFRAFTTLFNTDDDLSVISPLLGTGNQGLSPKKMMSAMVTSCASWMRAGMPLAVLKLVIYAQSPEAIQLKNNEKAIEQFAKLKKTLESTVEIPATVSKEHDALLIYASDDKEGVQHFVNNMNNESKDLKLRYNEVQPDPDVPSEKEVSIEEWSQQTEKTMLICRKVVCFLSPNFLASKECIDLYNLAMCLMRKWCQGILVPVYLLTMPYTPTYLTLNQWIDCRQKERDPPGTDRMMLGAGHLCELIANAISQEGISYPRKPQSFDIFISYCHRDCKIVIPIVDRLVKTDPNLKVFIDREELKTGFSWQASLYTALSNSSVVVAFLSPNYLNSRMCTEEFCIASSQNSVCEYGARVVSVLIDDLGTDGVDPMYSTSPCIRATSRNDSTTQNVVDQLLNLPEDSNKHNRIHLDYCLRNARRLFFKTNWQVNAKSERLELVKNIRDADAKSQSTARKVVICCHPHDMATANIIRKTILQVSKVENEETEERLALSVDIVSEDYPASHALIDSADIVVALLTVPFCTQPSTQCLLHMVLSIVRAGKCRLQAVVLSHIPRQPSYFQFLPVFFNVDDEIWGDITGVTTQPGYPLEIKSTSSVFAWRTLMVLNLRQQLAIRCAIDWMLHSLKHPIEQKKTPIFSITNVHKVGFDAAAVPVSFEPTYLESDQLTEIKDLTLAESERAVNQNTEIINEQGEDHPSSSERRCEENCDETISKHPGEEVETLDKSTTVETKDPTSESSALSKGVSVATVESVETHKQTTSSQSENHESKINTGGNHGSEISIETEKISEVKQETERKSSTHSKKGRSTSFSLCAGTSIVSQPDKRRKSSTASQPDRRGRISSASQPDKKGRTSSASQPDKRGKTSTCSII